MAGVIIKDYSFAYFGSSRPAVKNVNIEVERGEIVILAGPSGCGKSTLLRSIIGLIPHMYSGVREGTVTVDGLNVAEVPVSEVAKRVGYVFQNPENQIFMFSVERDIAFGLENLGVAREEIRERVEWAMNLLGIRDLAQRAPHELSDGQRQRVAIAGVLAMKPSVLILDEPTSLLDPRTAQGLVSLVRQLRDRLGITVLVVEHRLDLLAGIASRIIVMSEGEVILDGGPRDILTRKEAALVGIGIPTVTWLHILLAEKGFDVGPPPVLADELAERLRVILE